jgi:hypothetical protein
VALLLLECQGRKIEEDLGKKETKDYMVRTFEEVIKSEQKDITVQYTLAKDGYWCDASERAEFAEELKRQVQIAQWGPPAAQEMNPGLFGDAFVGGSSTGSTPSTRGTGWASRRTRNSR